MKGAELGQIRPWTAQIWAVARPKTAHSVSSARERRKRSTPSRRSNVAVDLEIDGSPASSPARCGHGRRGRERKASSPGSSPRARACGVGGLRTAEGVEGEARACAASAEVAGDHGDDGGVFYGRGRARAPRASSGQKEG